MRNAQTAKDCLMAVVRVNIGKYVVAQKVLNTMLVSGEPKCNADGKGKNKKCDGKCMPAKANKILKKMGEFQRITSEACKTYGMLFQEEIDIRSMTHDAQMKYYNLNVPEEVKGTPLMKNGKIILPEDAPQDIKNVAQSIREALIKNGMSGDMEIVDMKADNHGINPNDFEEFSDYIKAVAQARKVNRDIKSGKITAEEVVTNTVMHDAKENLEEVKGKA